jgi:hypothetical protein
MRTRVFFLLLAATSTLSMVTSYSQSPAPIVVQAAPTATNVVQAPAPAQASSDATAANLKVLRALKAGNEEILKKQKAALETLDELQKAADQIKVYSKRT